MSISIVDHHRIAQCLKGLITLLGSVLILSSQLSCTTTSPELTRLYQTSQTLPDQPPVILGRNCNPTPARIVIKNTGEKSYVRLWPREIKALREGVDYESLMLEPGDSSVTKVCKDHSVLTGNITYQDNLLHILLSGEGSCKACLSNTKLGQLPAHGSAA